MLGIILFPANDRFDISGESATAAVYPPPIDVAVHDDTETQ